MAFRDLLDNGDVVALGAVALLVGLGIAADKGLIPAIGSKDEDEDDYDYDYDE
jgi:hypothetical protein